MNGYGTELLDVEPDVSVLLEEDEEWIIDADVDDCDVVEEVLELDPPDMAEVVLELVSAMTTTDLLPDAANISCLAES